MRRLVDCCCPEGCEFEVFCGEAEPVTCPSHGLVCEQLWWQRPRRKRTEWDESDSVVVFKKPDGSYSYPARNDKPTPPGCERLVMRSLAAIRRHEASAGVRSEIADYDHGSGSGHEDYSRLARQLR